MHIYVAFNPTFHLRSQATVAYAEVATTPLEIRFTTPDEPLTIALTDDFVTVLFAISTREVNDYTFSETRRADSAAPTTEQLSKGKKRLREEDGGTEASSSGKDRRASSKPLERRKPMKVVQIIDTKPALREVSHDSIRDDSIRPQSDSTRPSPLQPTPQQLAGAAPSRAQEKRPLFLPGSQLSQAEQQWLRDAGLGDMTAQEVEEMFAEDDMGVGDLNLDNETPDSEQCLADNGEDSLDLIEEEMQPTQYDGGTRVGSAYYAFISI